MTKNQEIIGKILISRITKEKANNTLNVDDITYTLNIFLAGATITNDQFDTFIEMITPLAATNINTSTTTDTTQVSAATTTQATENNIAGATTTGTETTNTTAETK